MVAGAKLLPPAKPCKPNMSGSAPERFDADDDA
jgi:hypothetical protein